MDLTLSTKENMDTFLGILVLLGQIASIVAIVFVLIKKDFTLKNDYLTFISKNPVLIIFVVSLVSMLGSLYYSDIAMYDPCKLCWFQRIFMYPQVFLSGYALYKKDRNILNYLLILSVLGIIISTYHYYIQNGGNPLIPCSTLGQSATCSHKFVVVFDYITIPLMCFTGFLMNIITVWVTKMK